MINNIRKLLEKLKSKRKDEILFSPPLSELRNEFNFTPEMRLIIDPTNGNYFLADAHEFTHFDIMKEAHIDSKQNIEGGLYDDGFVWLRGHNIKKFLNKDLTPKEQMEWLHTTDFYKNLKDFITDVRIDNFFDWKQV